MNTDSIWIFTLLVAGLAGLVRGFAGFGGPAFMLAVLTWIQTPLLVIGKVLIVEFVSASYLVYVDRREINWRATALIAIPTLLTMPLGYWVLEQAEPGQMRRMIALVTLFSCLLMSLGWRYKHRLGTGASILLGLFAGLVFGASYIALVLVAVILSGPYTSRETRSLLVSWGFVIAVWYLVISITRGNTDLYTAADASAVAISYFLGTWTGARLFRRSSEQLYRRIALAVLALLSVASLLR